MNYTEEQKEIIHYDGDILVEALSGTGKTTTIKEFIKTRNPESRILYLAFNKSVQKEAELKFEDIDNVYIHVKTVHALAYKEIIIKKGYELGELNIEDVMMKYNISYELAVHIVNYVTLYSRVSEIKVNNVNYKSTIGNSIALQLYEENEDKIVLITRMIIKDMYNKAIPVNHDYYLKLYYMSKPRLDKIYDYICLDEAQDSSDITIEIFKDQKCKKVMVGDKHQQIYSWRNAINAMDKVNFKKFKLTESFRFNKNIAEKANQVISWKEKILFDKTVKDFNIIGSGNTKEIKTYGVIGRTNLSIIKYAIENVIINKNYKKIYFEGGFTGYSVTSMYTPIKDIENIHKGRYNKIKTSYLKDIKSIGELENFISKTEDIYMKQVLELYITYGAYEFINYVNDLKKICIDDKYKSDLILTTVHKSKGMEYDKVLLLDDFKDVLDFYDILKKSDNKYKTRMLINEEINLLYVALTRAKVELILPENIEKAIEYNNDKNKK